MTAWFKYMIGFLAFCVVLGGVILLFGPQSYRAGLGNPDKGVGQLSSDHVEMAK